MSDGGDGSVPLEKTNENVDENSDDSDTENVISSPEITKACELKIPKLTTSTPLTKFDKTRLDLLAVQRELSKLVPSLDNQEGLENNSASKYTDDTTLIEYHTPKNSTPFNSVQPTPGDTTPTNTIAEPTVILQHDSKLDKPSVKRNIFSTLPIEEFLDRPDNQIFSSNTDTTSSHSLSIESNTNTQKLTDMALTSAQYSDIIPSCKDVKDVEQFVSIVDELYKELEEDKKKIFLAITRAKITGKAFDAIKGKDTSTWELLKETLTKGLEEKVDMSTASNKLTHIKQLPEEKLKEYVERIKDALAVLNRTAIRQFSDETVKTQILALNDATAKNTFEAGLTDIGLKTVVVAAQKATFNDSFNFATNQQHTNFPMKKEEKNEKKANTEKKNINCFKCGKPNHYANECYANRIRSRSLPSRQETFRSFNANNNNFRNIPNVNNFRNNSYGYRNFNGTSNSYVNRDNRPIVPNTNTNSVVNGNSANNKNNWSKPNLPPFNSQYKNSNFVNNSANRNASNNNRGLSSNRNTIRVIRENETDWNEIVPLYENTTTAGNE
jgi:hypothetical protein